MKILFVSSYFGYKSGFNKASGDIFYSLLKTNNEIAVLTHYRKIPLPVETAKKYILIKAPWRLDFPELINRFSIRNLGKWLIRYLQDLGRKNHIRKVKKFSPDIIVINSYSSYLLDNLNYDKYTSVFISHGDVESSRTSLNQEENIEKTIKLLENFDYLIFVSENSKKEWLSFKKLKQKKSFYIPNCSDEKNSKKIMINSKDFVKAKLGFDPLKFNVVCVANIMKRKGQDILINNFSKILEIIPNINLYFVGSANTQFAKNIKKEAETNNLNTVITFCGLKKNAMEYIYAADLFILPSRAEALPLVILEAMILNTPIIASNVSGIPEMVSDGNDGHLFSLNNFDDFLIKLETLYANSKKRELFVKNDHKKYWQMFSRNKQIENYKLLFSSIAQNFSR